MIDIGGRLAVTFNGEIYNHRDLRAQLEASGVRFGSLCDTEVLLEAYRAWGTRCVEHLNGMFAFAIHDQKANSIFLARDRAGEKPLFFIEGNRKLAFASELKALLQDQETPRQVDLQALNHYLAYGYVPGHRCILRGVEKLEQGEAMTYDIGEAKVKRWRYWSRPEFEPNSKSPAELEEEVLALLRDSVRLRLQADVPVGVLLSGGIDSSLVAAVAAEVSHEPVRTFTVSFPGYGRYDEGPFARLVAQHLGTDHTELVAEATSVDLLKEMACQFDEPMADSSMIPTFLVSRLIRNHATVALSGDGGDELFGGYPHYGWLQRTTQLRRRTPRPMRVAAASVAAAVLPPGFRGRNHLVGLGDDEGGSMANVNLYFDPKIRRRIMPALQEFSVPELYAPEKMKRDLATGNGSLVHRASAVDFATYLVDDILVKVDRASMLASLEMRCPWLDHRMIDLAFSSVPGSLKATADEQKILTRRIARRLLPARLNLQRKQGFSLPLDSWFSGEWGEVIASVLLDGEDNVVDRAEVGRLLMLQRRGLRNTQRLFALALFELWRRQYHVTIAV